MKNTKIVALTAALSLTAGGFVATNASAEKYTIQSGDSLYAISKQYDTTVESLMEVNQLTSDLIYAGETLSVTGPSKAVIADTQQASAKTSSSQPAEQPASAQTNTAVASSAAPSNAAKTLTVEATAYTAYCNGCSGVTANGTNLRANPNLKVIAVDPSVIPLGTKVWVEGYGEAIAADTGGAIKGNKIDVFIPTEEDAYSWGRRTVTIKILN